MTTRSTAFASLRQVNCGRERIDHCGGLATVTARVEQATEVERVEMRDDHGMRCKQCCKALSGLGAPHGEVLENIMRTVTPDQRREFHHDGFRQKQST